MDKTDAAVLGFFVILAPIALICAFNLLSFAAEMFVAMGTMIAYALFLEYLGDRKIGMTKQTIFMVLGLSLLFIGPLLLHEIRFNEFLYGILWGLFSVAISAAGLLLMVFSGFFQK